MLRWFEYWLKRGDRSILATAPIRIFVMGDNRWREELEWPLTRAVPTPYFLGSGGLANTLTGDGSLRLEPAEDQPPDRFVYDPWDPVPTGTAGGYSRAPRDQRDIEARRDVLVYTSMALERELEVTGPLTLVLWASSSTRDTDFTGKLLDVHPDGRALPLNDGILRARYRKSRSSPEPLAPGEPVELTLDLGATSNVFLPGHRVRLEVSSSNFPRYDRNPNTGNPVAHESRLERADQTVYHDRERPSRLILPVVPR
jgi:hypothetical protein